MSLITMLDAAQGGALYANVGKATGLGTDAARAAMGALCPAIARQMHAKAKNDEALYDSLLDLVEDHDSDPGLDDPQAMTDAEAVSDGHAMLEDIYGSRNAAVSAFRKLVPDVSEAALPKLGAISATAVLCALAQTRAIAQPLTAAQPVASSGGGILAIIFAALLKGLLQGAQRSLAPRRRRRRSYGSYYRRRSTTRRRAARRTKRTPLEEIFGGILGTR